MPRYHLPRASCDLFIYDFTYDFSDIVGGYKLRRVCLHCDFFRRQMWTKPYRDLTEIVRKPHSHRAGLSSCTDGLRTEVARCPCDGLAEVARSRYADCAHVYLTSKET